MLDFRHATLNVYQVVVNSRQLKAVVTGIGANGRTQASELL